jgi:hypothetical protein
MSKPGKKFFTVRYDPAGPRSRAGEARSRGPLLRGFSNLRCDLDKDAPSPRSRALPANCVKFTLRSPAVLSFDWRALEQPFLTV